MLHSAVDCTGLCTNWIINDGMVGSMGSRTDTVKQQKKSENKWNKYLKALNNKNKIIYRIAKNYVS